MESFCITDTEVVSALLQIIARCSYRFLREKNFLPNFAVLRHNIQEGWMNKKQIKKKKLN